MTMFVSERYIGEAAWFSVLTKLVVFIERAGIEHLQMRSLSMGLARS